MVVMLRVLRRLAASGVAACLVVPLAATSANAAPSGVRAAVDCAALNLTARPKINAQNAPYETIRNTVVNCSSATETVMLTQRIVGPFIPRAAASSRRSWTLTLGPGQSVVKIQRIPYVCCGSYTVHDDVLSSSNQVLARKRASFTFA
jgi:hypothetical protein